MSSFQYLFKYILVGDSCVGKTCLLSQFINKRFKTDHDATIGVEFGASTIKVLDQLIKISIWDTAGQESFHSITRSYYRGFTKISTKYQIDIFGVKNNCCNSCKWLEETKMYANEKIQIFLVGNKTDLENEREIAKEEGMNYAEKHKLAFIEASAKNGENVDMIFQQSAERVFSLIKEGKIDPTNEVDFFICNVFNKSLGISIGSKKIVTNQQNNEKACCKF